MYVHDPYLMYLYQHAFSNTKSPKTTETHIIAVLIFPTVHTRALIYEEETKPTNNKLAKHAVISAKRVPFPKAATCCW
jgi:hypothetical protein